MSFMTSGLHCSYSKYMSLDRFNLGNGEGLLEYNATRIDDGLWHRIRATR